MVTRSDFEDGPEEVVDKLLYGALCRQQTGEEDLGDGPATGCQHRPHHPHRPHLPHFPHHHHHPHRHHHHHEECLLVRARHGGFYGAAQVVRSHQVVSLR